MSEILFDRIALIGIGLIGSSIARDVKKLGLAKHVVISTRSLRLSPVDTQTNTSSGTE